MTRPRALTHLDAHGHVRMVDVSQKAVTVRRAVAEATVRMASATLAAIRKGRVAKGDVGALVRVAAIQGAKRTADLVPLCHPVALDHVAVEFTPVASKGKHGVATITVTASTAARTGVEMEAMTGAAAGALALYDMVKGLERGVTIESIRLLSKEGGRSGVYRR